MLDLIFETYDAFHEFLIENHWQIIEGIFILLVAPFIKLIGAPVLIFIVCFVLCATLVSAFYFWQDCRPASTELTPEQIRR